MTSTVLLVEDDAALRSLVTETLMEAKYSVVKAASGKEALKSFHEFQPDLAILDIGLDDIDGLELCRQIRSYRNIPVMFLTARDSEMDQIQGFASGGDDYITKPFSPKLLSARVDAIFRRGSGQKNEKTRFTAGPLELDIDRHSFKVDGTPIRLTKHEFDLVKQLIHSPERVITRDELIKNAWGDWFGDTHIIECHISRIRSKVKKAGGPYLFKAVHGVGYQLGLSA